MSITVTQAPVAPAAAHATLLTGLGTCTVVIAAWAWSPAPIAFGAVLAGFVGARPLSRLVFEQALRPDGPVGALEVQEHQVRFIANEGLTRSVSRGEARGLVATTIVGGVFPGRQLSVFLAGGEVIEWFLDGEAVEIDQLLDRISTALGQTLS